ncbi:MAG: xanthine dehydrogenase molybdopterin binding subunit, partial [Rhizobacter sp.]|nr:xanthine dehydrogenase molybdopterin binding subunit [Rhizobacter sp.]
MGGAGRRRRDRSAPVNRALDPRLLRPAGDARAGKNGARVGVALPHESAHLHVAGVAPYVDDLPELAGTLHAALGLSPVAHGRLVAIDRARIAALPGVVDVIVAADIPGPNDCGPVLHDDPILADGLVHYVGQPVFSVIAETRDLARRAAALAREALTIEPLAPILTPVEAHAAKRYVLPPMHLARGDARAAIAAAPHRLADTFDIGGQEQFYLEGQVSYAIPREDRGVFVHCSTQHPSEMQHLVAKCLGLSSHHVQVECRRMGGGFGGKESQSGLFACVAAIAATRLGRPVKLRLDRDDDFLVTGRRHCFHYELDAGYDDEGRIVGAELTMVSRAGFSADLSGPVMTRAICHFDNAYWLPHVEIHGYSGRTNTQSNTAFRGFGGPQGAIAVEHAIDTIARRLGKDPLDVRRANFYGPSPRDADPGERNVTPYGQLVADNIIAPLVDELERTSAYRARRDAIRAFNAHSEVLKRGIALTPVKFGISFNLVHLNQAGALVHVYGDGSFFVDPGATEMGQGLHTKVAQVVAHALGVDFDAVRISATDTHKVANTSATAASTGSDLNGKAAEDAALQIRDRLVAFACEQIRSRLAVVAAGQLGIDADDVRFGHGVVTGIGFSDRQLAWADLVRDAYFQRVQLWAAGFYRTAGLHWDSERMQGEPFKYFAYGAAVSEVEVDGFTGSYRLLRTDIVHDVGDSLSPLIDLGQI